MAIIPSESIEERTLQIDVLKICTGCELDVEEGDGVRAVRHLQQLARSEPKTPLERDASSTLNDEEVLRRTSVSMVRLKIMATSVPQSSSSSPLSDDWEEPNEEIPRISFRKDGGGISLDLLISDTSTQKSEVSPPLSAMNRSDKSTQTDPRRKKKKKSYFKRCTSTTETIEDAETMAIIPSESIEERTLQIDVLKICTGCELDVEEGDGARAVRHLQQLARSEPRTPLERDVSSELNDEEDPGSSVIMVITLSESNSSFLYRVFLGLSPELFRFPYALFGSGRTHDLKDRETCTQEFLLT
ncbi:hypothetical protein Cni_G26931 [Canna indica]|uniref:Uncharacterized protein n=1 Tax=Canna indica TaxID=4628 RepID=A0AAQ3KZU7_9LILI|nr:hypothetical protein Cni_G26931 [Canna indica]